MCENLSLSLSLSARPFAFWLSFYCAQYGLEIGQNHAARTIHFFPFCLGIHYTTYTHTYLHNQVHHLNWLEKHIMYTVLHIFRQVLFGPGNQGNHQNFNLSLLSYKCWLIFIGMKQKKGKFKIQNGRLKKKWEFQLPQFSIFFRQNFRDWSLGKTK